MKHKIFDLFMLIKRNIKLQIITCVLLSFFVIILYIILGNIIPYNHNYTVSDYIRLINQIDDIKVIDNKIEISGFAFMLNTDSEDTKIHIILKNVKDGEEIRAKVKQTTREDVDTYFSSDFNYKNSGFYATVKDNKLKENECYEIIVMLDYINRTVGENGKIVEENLKKAVTTNRFILNKELYNFNPDIFYINMNIQSEILGKL